MLVCRGQALREEARKILRIAKVAPPIFFVVWILSDPSPIIALPCHYNWLTNSLMWLWLIRKVAQYFLSILGVSLGGIIWRCRTAHWNASLMTKYLERIAPTGHRGGRCSLFSAMQCFKWCDVYQFLIIQYLGDALKKKKKNIDHGAPVAYERTKNFLWSNCQQRARMFFLTLSRLSEKTSTSMVLMKLKKTLCSRCIERWWPSTHICSQAKVPQYVLLSIRWPINHFCCFRRKSNMSVCKYCYKTIKLCNLGYLCMARGRGGRSCENSTNS